MLQNRKYGAARWEDRIMFFGCSPDNNRVSLTQRVLSLVLIRFSRFRSSNALFDLVWQADGSVCFRANNGKYVATKRSGHLYANSDTVEESCKYFFYLINR